LLKLESKDERSDDNVTPLFIICIAYSKEDTNWQTVWLGWHAAEIISAAPKG